MENSTQCRESVLSNVRFNEPIKKKHSKYRGKECSFSDIDRLSFFVNEFVIFLMKKILNINKWAII